MLQWGHRFTSVETLGSQIPLLCLSSGFNGATDLHRWKRSGAVITPQHIFWLQWGHRFTSVETNKHSVIVSPRGWASMGPPIYIGGNQSLCKSCHSTKTRFNGATDLHRWKPPLYRWCHSTPSCFNGATDLHRWKQIVILLRRLLK